MAVDVHEPVSSAAVTAPAPTETVVLPKTSESDTLLRIRHSMSHVMAMAVQKLFPQARSRSVPGRKAASTTTSTARIPSLRLISRPSARR